MSKEIMPITLPDPEICQAQETTMKLIKEFYSCQDPLSKNALKVMVWDEIDYVRELRRKVPAKEAVKQLHEILKPEINLN
jgi:hypothetical protein